MKRQYCSIQRALHIREQVIGSEHLKLVAMPLNSLATIYYKEQGLYEEAETSYEQALYIWEQALGSDHPDIAYALNGSSQPL